MEVRLHDFQLPLRHPFTIARGTTTVQHSLVVELRQNGHCGWGEAPITQFYDATAERIREGLETVRSMLEQWTLGEPAALWDACLPALAENRFTLGAIDGAAHDLWGKLNAQPISTLWGTDPGAAPPSSYTIGMDTPDKMIAKLEEMPGWPVYKIKLGTADDLAVARALRKRTDAPLRVDANCGWTAANAGSLAVELPALGVEFIEQPLPPDDHTAQKQLFQDSPLPLFADESCVVEEDVDACADRFHGINIKLCKCGGLTPARRMVDRARELNLQVMVGCMTESTVGISAAAQLAPLVDFADLDGAVLLARDIATGARVHAGGIDLPETPGLGLTLI